MKRTQAEAIVRAVTAWAIQRHDVRAVALLGSWARGNPRPTSDIDLLLLSDRARTYVRSRKWLAEIDFNCAGYRIRSGKGVTYGAVWSQHLYLVPPAEVELTIAAPAWAGIAPIDEGTRRVVTDAFRILVDKDGRLARLVAATMAMSADAR
jgi:hypothetical protein